MSEAYTYGGDGIKERIEYNRLSEQDLQEYIDMASQDIESIFSYALPSDRVTLSYFTENNISTRYLGFAYATASIIDEPTLLFDIENVTVKEFQPPVIPVVNAVTVEHEVHPYGILNEEYKIAIKRWVNGTNGMFVSSYLIRRYSGNHWQTWVEYNDLGLEPEEQDSKNYTRPMTEYDFNEFFKDTAEIKGQLLSVLVQ